MEYEDYDYFISLLTSVGTGCFISKADIESAFRIIPVHPTSYHLLGFAFDGDYYFDVFQWDAPLRAKSLSNLAVPYNGSCKLVFTLPT